MLLVHRVPRGLEDVSKYPELFAELLRSGQWSVQELKNLAGLNMLRVMRQVEKVMWLSITMTINIPKSILQRL